MATRTYIGNGKDPSVSGTTKTYSGQGIGTAAADRTVVVVVNGTTSGGTLSSLTATLGGNAMTSEILINGDPDAGTNNSFVAILSLAVASGTTATIALTASRTCFDINIEVYAIYGNIAGTKVTSSGKRQTDGAISLNLNTVNNGIVIAGSHGYFYQTVPPAAGDAIWAGVTRDDSFTNYTNDICDGASLQASSTETPRTVSLTVDVNIGTGTCSVCAAVVSYSPSATAYTLTASGGTYTETGTAASLVCARKISATSGTYSETGTATTLRCARKFSASSGTYSFTGTAAGLKYGRNLVSSSGTYSISGTAVALRCARKLAVSSGTYSFTGSSAALDKGFTLSVSSGVYTLTGTAVGFKRTYAVVALTTSFDFVGSDVILTYSAAVIIPSDTGEHPDATEIENYFRRYANDRDVLCVPENLASETATVDEVSTDNHFESYVRRYGNDNV